MNWHLSHRFDPRARELADRHYSRKSPGTPQFSPPGRLLVLVTLAGDAVWVTVWQAHVQHRYAGAWMNSLFRNEGPLLSSALIREAVAATAWKWPQPVLDYPLITFVDRRQVRPKRDPGYCYLAAGWHAIGRTPSGLLVFGCPAANITDVCPPHGAQLEAFA
jgi:hypothetical protein